MTRGRPPKKAVKEALEPARGRGSVVELPDTSGLPCDLMIFSPSCIVFVKVKRMRAKVQGPPEVEIRYGSEVRALRVLPKSSAAVMELWILSSHTMWQYFHILSDTSVELRDDGTPLAGTGQSTGDCPAPPPACRSVPTPEDCALPAVLEGK